MSLSIKAYQASRNAQSDATNSIVNAYQAIAQDRARQDAFNLQMADFYTGIDDVKRNEYLDKIENGHGLVGLARSIFGKDYKTDPVKSVSQLTEYKGIDRSGIPEEQKVSYGKINPDLLAKAWMGNRDGAENYFRDNSGNIVKADKSQLKSIKAIEKASPKTEEERLLLEEREVAKNNKLRQALDFKAQKEEERLMREDPSRKYAKWISDNKIEIPTEYKGSRSDMYNQNYNFYAPLIEKAKGDGDFAMADRFNREWQANNRLIDANWNKKGEKHDDLFDISAYTGKSGEKYVKVPIQRRLRGSSTIEAYVNEENIPESIYRKGKPAIQKYLAERDPHSYGGDVIDYIATPKGDQTTGAQKENREIDDKNKYYSDRLEVAKALIEEGKKTNNAYKIKAGEEALKEAQAYFGSN